MAAYREQPAQTPKCAQELFGCSTVWIRMNSHQGKFWLLAQTFTAQCWEVFPGMFGFTHIDTAQRCESISKGAVH